MIKRTLQEVAGMIGVGDFESQHSNVLITGVTIDTRKITAGNLFVPFKGERADGHAFVEEAINQGAAAALWQSNVPNPPMHLPIILVEDTLIALQELARSYRKQLNVKTIGITGSNGKTTTKDMTASLLSLKYKVQKTEGNYNNHIGLPLTILGLEEDTELAVLEMGMSGKGEIDFLSRLAQPEVVMITNIGEAHLQDLGSKEGIAQAKLEIINGLKSDGCIIYIGDEPLLQQYFEQYNGGAVLKTFGSNTSNDLYPTHISQSDDGSCFKVNISDREFKLPVLGTHNVLNALAAMTAASFYDISFEDMNEGLSKIKLTNMRMELLQGKKGERIINDAYNASPTSTNAAIELIANLPGYQNKILVLGDMLELGEEEKEYHIKVGESIDPNKISAVFTYGELGQFIAEGARRVFPEDRVYSFKEKQPLIVQLQKLVNQETIVLVKASRGMKLEEVVAGLQE
ncbi:UDP-N-acetylmuramoyl-tripeptide--D-alanyl-D-alanine ligase [Bacillus mesophilum]|uniref:UDP-N-acetylmuramoyl-tripeptide--D-alanyl-D-alanine ligase n=1 Tax=Bacillus mesophilum TaxID=1071718 RepID=A0A7V7RJ06_9BACI|nr:UDP-N-acetylmuramoyl-tripeptide--D-alanyl-D-alanine ligase [Bacillus mesophilum]KAB2330579.1 UDP-N-acetylmuramoyl-tripeptide--D-alanyl-D-alanine ligase [Bacillus mesophilum]